MCFHHSRRPASSDSLRQSGSACSGRPSTCTREIPPIRWNKSVDRAYNSNAAQQVTKSVGLPLDVEIRPWNEDDFPAIQHLSRAEGWPSPVDRPADAIRAWRGSWPALVAVHDGVVVGFLRAVSDGAVTTYVAEILVGPEWRGCRVGVALLAVAQHLCAGTRLDLLATGQSRTFYDRVGFRAFPGYRRNWAEFESLLGDESS